MLCSADLFQTNPVDFAATGGVTAAPDLLPAGRVEGQPGSPEYTEDDLAGKRTPEAYFPQDGDVVGYENEPLGEEVPADRGPKRGFQPGDLVLVNGTSYLRTKVTDLEGTVVPQHEAGALWRSTQREGYTVLVRDDQNRFMYFQPESVTLVKEA